MEVSFPSSRSYRRLLFLTVLCVIILSCFRLAHVGLLWADEDYHLAAAINLTHGRLPYRDFWYDKPPLTAFYYLLIDGWAGWPLRLLDAAYIVICCAMIYNIATTLWTYREGLLAALLLAFYTTFYLPSAVIPFAADAILLLPHLLAIRLALHKQPIAAGVAAGVGFLANTKGMFVLASCALFLLPQLLGLLLAFAVTAGLGLVTFALAGAWPGYVEQVWHWGMLYARDAPVANPFLNGITRTAHWLGFHAALAFGAAASRANWRLGGWTLLSFAAVALGGRFAPHYFLQVLPPLIVIAARGMLLLQARYGRVAVVVLVVLLAVPVVRFGPRYFELSYDDIIHRAPAWADTAMDLDSQAVATQLRRLAQPTDTLLVWGYRPDIYVDTRMVPDSRFWDSQPLTGVPADRHLSATTQIYTEPARQNRLALARTQPTWIVDGLSLFNPRLSINAYPELRPWFNHYQLVGRTRLSLLYKRRN